jgi:hypothetical protein
VLWFARHDHQPDEDLNDLLKRGVKAWLRVRLRASTILRTPEDDGCCV